MKCKPEITQILEWFGQMTYIHLRGPSSMRLPPSTSKSLKMEGQIPLLQPFTSSSTSYKFSIRKNEENSLANWKQDLLRLSKTFLSIKFFSKVLISAEIWGVFIGLKRIQIWAPKIWILLCSRCWRCHRLSLSNIDSAGRCHHLGQFSSLVGLQTWPKPVRTRAQLAPTWVIGLTPNPNPN